ncbi:hypothetical protein FB451DRAFT_1038724 [Mycena latifolia]|nr:hypothetical protein FB451DRAFT_1067782 [Mycena latifolia]KAJ7469427.1 hypothetical protein FB451DRAFT_1038724 [Mycena latifolia]
MWEERAIAPINKDILHLPVEEGGKNLLSIRDRNDAIKIKTLQSYLTRDENRGKWCDLADQSFRKSVPEGRLVEKRARISPFTQTWSPLQRKLPRALKQMIKTAAKFQLKFDALSLAKDVKEELPVWFNIGGKKDLNRHNNSNCAKCLRNIHGVRTVGHILDIIQRNYHRHSRRRNCACNSCRADRLLGCDYPYKCQEEAIKILDCIDEKWDPRCTTNQPNAELTAEERTANSQALEDKKEVIFDPRITLNQPSSNGFRIFCNINCNSPANQLDPLEEEGESFREAVYIGNAHEINEDGEHCSAGGVWYGPEDPRNTSVRVEKELASKEGGVVAAILYTIQNSPREVSIDFWINSKRILRALTTDLDESEDKGWIGVNDKVLLKTIVAALRGRGTRCTLREAGESENQAMQRASELARLGLHDGEPVFLQMDIPPAFNLTGMKLKKGSQASFYKAIKASKPKPERMKTTMMLDITRHAAKNLSGRAPIDSQIWLSIRHQDITRTTRDFMWRCLHQAYKLGDYWRNIPTYEQRATCPNCQVDETMEHILLECSAPGQEILWKLARELWEMKGYQWPEMNYGSVFACALVDVRNQAGKRDEGANRLFRILISETAHLIWKFRCTRVIDRGNDPTRFFTEAELHNKWLHCINSRLRTDALLTNSKKYGNRALNPKKVMNTWNGVLKDAENLSDTWVWQSGFLVGIPPLRPPGRNQ